MVTFLVLNIITTILTAAASIILTLALSLWNAAVNTAGCYTEDNTCVCDDGQTTYYGILLILILIIACNAGVLLGSAI